MLLKHDALLQKMPPREPRNQHTRHINHPVQRRELMLAFGRGRATCPLTAMYNIPLNENDSLIGGRRILNKQAQ